jgi:hypothetical protein
MTIKFTNNATTTLASGINSSVTSLTVATGTGALFPSLSGSDVFYVTLANLTGTVEIVKVTARSSDTFTIVRGQDNTTAAAWVTGDKVELRPTAGILNTFVQQDPTAPSTFGFKNRIINGAMMIDQRNVGASVANIAGSAWSVDRWRMYATQATKFTLQQNAGSVTPPAGYKNYLGLTVSNAYSVGASDEFLLLQSIEGLNIADLAWGTASASPVTMSFWVRSSLTGTFGGTLQNDAQTQTYPFTFSISSANTWEYKTIPVAGATAGTWDLGTAKGIRVCFSMGSGSSTVATAGAWNSGGASGATGQTQVVANAGATFYITGVQLEKGSTATAYDFRSYGTEFALCQRYYWKVIGTSTYTPCFCSGFMRASTTFQGVFKMPVTMRAAPSISATNSASAFYVSTSADANANTVSLGVSGVDSVTVNATTSTGSAGQGGILYPGASGSPYIDFSAEL